MPNESRPIDRRWFHRLTLSAFAGAIAGTAGTAVGQERSDGRSTDDEDRKPRDTSNPLLHEPNICRGLNTCRGKGRGGKNACAGRSACATAPKHPCAGHNACRGLGACDEGDPQKFQVGYPGENTCKGLGACGIPIPAKKDHIWRQARRRFEAVMKDAGKQVGAAPARGGPPRRFR